MNPEAQKISKFGAVAAIATLGITLYWTFTYTGPYRYLAESQIRWFGYYEPKLTAAVIVLGFLLLAAAINVVSGGAPRADATAVPVRNVRNSLRPQPWLEHARYAGPLIVVGLGGWFYLNGTQARDLQQWNAADFESGKLHSRILYGDVRGHLGTMYLSKEDYLYIPMSSQAGGGSPVRLVVGVNEKDADNHMHAEADGSVTVRGVVDKGLRGDVRYAFEKNGMAVADTVWVVHVGRAPSDDRMIGAIMAAIGVVFAGLLLGADSYRKKRAAWPFEVPDSGPNPWTTARNSRARVVAKASRQRLHGA